MAKKYPHWKNKKRTGSGSAFQGLLNEARQLAKEAGLFVLVADQGQASGPRWAFYSLATGGEVLEFFPKSRRYRAGREVGKFQTVREAIRLAKLRSDRSAELVGAV